jgi:hypothetical protein
VIHVPRGRSLSLRERAARCLRRRTARFPTPAHSLPHGAPSPPPTNPKPHHTIPKPHHTALKTPNPITPPTTPQTPKWIQTDPRHRVRLLHRHEQHPAIQRAGARKVLLPPAAHGEAPPARSGLGRGERQGPGAARSQGPRVAPSTRNPPSRGRGPGLPRAPRARLRTPLRPAARACPLSPQPPLAPGAEVQPPRWGAGDCLGAWARHPTLPSPHAIFASLFAPPTPPRQLSSLAPPRHLPAHTPTLAHTHNPPSPNPQPHPHPPTTLSHAQRRQGVPGAEGGAPQVPGGAGA